MNQVDARIRLYIDAQDQLSPLRRHLDARIPLHIFIIETLCELTIFKILIGAHYATPKVNRVAPLSTMAMIWATKLL